MKTKRKRLWLTAIAALSLFVGFMGGCKDDNVEIVGVCPLVISTNPTDLATNVPLNQVITVTFNEAMNPLTITPSSFTIDGVAKKKSPEAGIKESPALKTDTPVEGTVTVSGATATFTPTSNLSPNFTYTGTIATTVKDLTGNSLQVNYAWTFSTGTNITPTVISTDPLNLAVGVALNKVISANFSTAMDPLTITTSTFTLLDGTTTIPGAVSYSGITATFTPTNPLILGKTYTAKVSNGAKNVTGTPIGADYVWTFSTGAVIVPSVISTDPLNLATNVALNKVISANFSLAMNPSTITTTTFTLKDGATTILGAVSYSGTTATFTPTNPLVTGKTYTATITTGAKNVAGTAIANNYIWTFSTGAVLAPTVISTDPLDLEVGVALNKVISATFSEAMNNSTITTLTFTLTDGVTPAGGSISIIGSTAYFTPTALLLSDATYTATITTGVQNLAGTPLASNYVWTFSTGAHAGPIAPDLQSVARFGIISGVGVTNAAGPSEIHDLDVGIYPGVRTSITGFFDVDGGPGLIFNGAFYASDDVAPPGVAAMLLAAKNDLVAAYLFAEGATSPAPAIVAGDQGGTTLYPGIYKSTSTLLIQSGDLTLDAQGDVNATWIFQIASDFTTIGGAPYPSPSGGNVILTGGAQAKNIYWQVGSSAVIGDYTSFKGNILALTSITMNSFSRAQGRMLTQNAAVTLTSTNIITKP